MTNISKDFAYYLKQRHAFSNFVRYTKRDEEHVTWCYFNWDDTKEGVAYWQDIFNGFIPFIEKKYDYIN
jgi:hypothetical protein